MTTATKNDLRAVMPETASFVDRLRVAFGEVEINRQIRGGLKGKSTFWAIENGVQIGTRDMSYRWIVLSDKRGNPYTIEADWIYQARLIGRAKGELLPTMDPNGCDKDSHRIANRAREIMAEATPDEIQSAVLIKRDDYR